MKAQKEGFGLSPSHKRTNHARAVSPPAGAREARRRARGEGQGREPVAQVVLPSSFANDAVSCHRQSVRRCATVEITRRAPTTKGSSPFRSGQRAFSTENAFDFERGQSTSRTR